MHDSVLYDVLVVLTSHCVHCLIAEDGHSALGEDGSLSSILRDDVMTELPPNHWQSLASAYYNVGTQQEFIQEFAKALVSYRLGRVIAKERLGPSHSLTRVCVETVIFGTKRKL